LATSKARSLDQLESISLESASDPVPGSRAMIRSPAYPELLLGVANMIRFCPAPMVAFFAPTKGPSSPTVSGPCHLRTGVGAQEAIASVAGGRAPQASPQIISICPSPSTSPAAMAVTPSPTALIWLTASATWVLVL
jgi:hypothetical protein